MKQVITGTCLAAAFAVGLAAQTPPTQTPPPSSPSPMARQDSKDATKDAKTVTVTGCLKPGEGADAYILSDLKWAAPSAGSTAVGTSGTTAAPAAIASATTLAVKAKGDAKLSEHVGHQVEVTGNISEKEKSSTASPTDPAAPPSASASAAPTFEARTVKMIAATCSM
jgi:hypothetical protein